MKYMDQNVIISHIVDSSLLSCWNVMGASSGAILLHDRDEAHYTLRKSRIVYTSFFFCSFIALLYLTVSG